MRRATKLARVLAVAAATSLCAVGAASVPPAAAVTIELPPYSARPQTAYAYVESAADGGSLDVSGTVRDRSSDLAHFDHMVMTITDPAGKKTTVTVEDTNNPDKPKSFKSTGLTSSTAGVWSIHTEMRNESNELYPYGGMIQPMSIVVKSDGQAKSGRVWWERLALEQRDAPGFGDNNVPRDLTLWTLGPSGVRHKISEHRYHGISSDIVVDTLGVADSACRPLYRSADWNQMSGQEPGNEGYGSTGTYRTGYTCTNEISYRLFWEKPDSAMPATAAISGGSTWVMPAYRDPTVTVAYAQGDPASATLGGTITANVNQAGTLNVAVDTNRDGTADRTIFTQQVAAGKTSIPWDGKDSQGKAIGRGQAVDLIAKLDGIGEVHWVLRDVEQRFDGFSIEQVVGPNPGNKKVSWNDSHLASGKCWRLGSSGSIDTVDSCRGQQPKKAIATDTTDGSAHGWGPDSDGPYTGTFGDSRWIDEWQRDTTAVTASSTLQDNAKPHLRVAVTDGVKTVAPRETLTYVVSAQNTHQWAGETKAVIGAVLPPHTTFVSADQGGVYDPETRAVTWPAAQMAAGSAGKRTMVVTVDAGAPRSGTLPAYATISGTASEQTAPADPATDCPADVCASDVDDLVAADIRVLKEEVMADLGDGLVTWLVSVANAGDAPARELVVTDRLPESVVVGTVVVVGSDGEATGAKADAATGEVSWRIDELAPGQTVMFEISGTVADPARMAGQALRNIVRASTPDDPGKGDPAAECEDNDSIESDTDGCDVGELIPGGGLAVAKDDGLEVVAPGDTLTYTVVVTNAGPKDRLDATVVDLLPGQVEFVSASDEGVFDPVAGTVTWDGVAVEAGGQAERKVTVTVVEGAQPGEVPNYAVVLVDGAQLPADPASGCFAPLCDVDTDTIPDPELVVAEDDPPPGHGPKVPAGGDIDPAAWWMTGAAAVALIGSAVVLVIRGHLRRADD